MSPPPAASAPAIDADEALDPALLRLIEALARAHVEEDYAAALAAANPERP